ncbi:hypothetical protein DIPPA_29169 [Diplonema papillatum]|nr:hypothetical protein DIPPA_29169 [Diplonema papillatum]
MHNLFAVLAVGLVLLAGSADAWSFRSWAARRRHKSVHRWQNKRKREAYKFSLPGDSPWPKACDWASLKERLQGDVYVRCEEGYNLTELYSLPLFNFRAGTPEPAAIGEPETAEDVQQLVRFARKHRMRAVVFATGHSHGLQSTGDNTLMIRMRRFKTVVVNAADLTVTIGGGTTGRDAATGVVEQTNGDYTVLHGTAESVGMWGWTAGGGVSTFSAQYGLGADVVVGATVVTGDGDIVHATMDNEHKDLLWAVKGGAGNSFGVGISLTIKIVPRPKVVHTFLGLYPQTNATADGFAVLTENEPDNAGAYYLIGFAPNLVSIIAFCADDGCSEYMAALEALPGCLKNVPGVQGPPRCFPFPMTNYPNDYFNFFAISKRDPHEYLFGCAQYPDYAEGMRRANEWILQPEPVTFKKECYISTIVGGAVQRNDPDGTLTAVSPQFRSVHGYFECTVHWDPDLSYADRITMLKSVYEFEKTQLRPLAPGAAVYWNDGPYVVEPDWQVRLWGSQERYDRLLAIKKKYDRRNFMTCHNCVGWDLGPAVEPLICRDNCSCSNNPTGECSVYDDSYPACKARD